jgi:preprotein translocase subunit SecE
VATDTLDNVKARPGGDEPSEGGALPAPQKGLAGIGDFIGRVRDELKRVTWPTKTEVYATTLVVILTSMFFGLYLFGIDLLLNSLVQRLFQRFGGA